jgi:predicted HTH transcriptional regulator
MADFVDATVREIDSRIEELREELTKLEAAKAALVGIRRGPGRPKGSTNTPHTSTSASNGHSGRRRGPGRPRGRRGGNTRSNQALQLVSEQPGITIPQIADQLSIEPNYLYRVMPKLVSDGLVKREGQGWHPATSAAPAVAVAPDSQSSDSE